MLNTDGVSPLHHAFQIKDDKLVQKILDSKEKITTNYVDQENLSNLHIACAASHTTAAKCFLWNGSDPNLPVLKDIVGDEDFIFNHEIIRAGSTSLHIAVKTWNYKLINLLLSFGADHNAVDADGITPFQSILESYDALNFIDTGNSEKIAVLHYILNSNVKVQMTKALSFTILQSISLKLYRTTLFKRLISEFLIKKQYEILGLSKLHAACAFGDLSIVREEIESGTDVNQSISLKSDIWPGDTALHILFRGDSWHKYEISKLLRNHGADPTLKNASCLTPIHLSKNKDLEIATLLLRSKFTNVNPVNNEGLSHFHLCCMTSNVLVVEEFLEAGVNVNAPVGYSDDYDAYSDDSEYFHRWYKYNGYTPLHFAVRYGCKEIIELLISRGADLSIMNVEGDTPFHLMLSNFIEDRVKDLLRYVYNYY